MAASIPPVGRPRILPWVQTTTAAAPAKRPRMGKFKFDLQHLRALKESTTSTPAAPTEIAPSPWTDNIKKIQSISFPTTSNVSRHHHTLYVPNTDDSDDESSATLWSERQALKAVERYLNEPSRADERCTSFQLCLNDEIDEDDENDKDGALPTSSTTHPIYRYELLLGQCDPTASTSRAALRLLGFDRLQPESDPHAFMLRLNHLDLVPC